MRYSSVLCTEVAPRRPRRRLGFLVCIRCRRPALVRRTLPEAVILKRLAAAFLVLMPLGRRINQSVLLQKRAHNIGRLRGGSKADFEDFSRLGSARSAQKPRFYRIYGVTW